MTATANIINREILELQVQSKEEYLKLKDEIEDLVNNKIPEKAESVYSDIFSADEIVRLDRLNIDLGIISPFNLSENLLQKFSSVFKEELVRVKENKKYVKDYTGSALQLLIFFLLHGDFPWWASKKAEIDLYSIFQRVLNENFKELISFLIKHPDKKEIFLRIENQFSGNIFEDINQLLIKNYFPDIDELLRNILKLLSALTFPQTIIKSIDKIITTVLLSSLRTHKEISEQQLASEIFVQFSIINSLTEEDFYDKTVFQLQKISKGLGVIDPHLLRIFINLLLFNYPEILEKHSDIIIKILQEQIKLTSLPDLEDTLGIIMQKVYSAKNSFDKQLKKIKVQKDLPEIPLEEPEDETDEIFVSNAGISLIAVYLPSLFDKLNLLKDGVFENRNNENRAALLINYISYKKTEAYEFNLQLNKILCGIPINETLPKEIKISKLEVDEIDLLLESVIKNWTEIKNTSVEGLRTAFLEREGILYDKGNSYQLKVDRKPHDIILETLPWSISIIKYNWMKKPIYVEW